MGSCFSSSRNGTQPETQRRDTARSVSTGRGRNDVPLDEVANAPLRPTVWRQSNGTNWTRARLDQERQEFFETRTSGRPEIWSALSGAINMLRAGDIAGAQAVLDAAGVTLPRGDLAEGAYDPYGAHYAIPHHIISDPTNIRDGPPHAEDATGETSEGSVITRSHSQQPPLVEKPGTQFVPQDADGLQAEPQVQAGGDSSEQTIEVFVRINYNSKESDLRFKLGTRDTLKYALNESMKRLNIESDKVRTKTMYLGRVLEENKPLLGQGYREGTCLGVMVLAKE